MIETERLILRQWQPDDIRAFVAMNADPRVMEFFVSTLTEEQSIAFAGRIAEHFAEKGFGWWAVEVRGSMPFAGFVGLSVARFEAHFTPCVEIGWRLVHAAWGKGYATELVLHCVVIARRQTHWPVLRAFAHPDNIASQRVLSKAGFRQERFVPEMERFLYSLALRAS